MTWAEIRVWLATPEPIWPANGQPLKGWHAWFTVRQFRARLKWQHGRKRTNEILWGRDARTADDLCAWNLLGEPKTPDAA